MALPIKKIYIDTKYKARESISNSNFKIDLPQTLSFPENSVFYIDDVSIPHSWYTIEENVNDKLFVMISRIVPDEDNSGTAYKIVTISPGIYNGTEIALEMQTKIRETIFNVQFPDVLSVAYNNRKNTINITINYTDWHFKILTEDDISTKLNDTWIGDSYDSNNPHSINDIISNNYLNSPFYTLSNGYTGGLNLQPIRNIYIHSSLGNYNTLGARNETSIIKKVPVSSNSGDYIFDQVLVGNDFGDCSKQTLRTISFELKNVHGDNINFHGSNLSFSIIFSKMNPEM